MHELINAYYHFFSLNTTESQAERFITHPGSRKEGLSADIQYTYNEVLSLWAENGRIELFIQLTIQRDRANHDSMQNTAMVALPDAPSGLLLSENSGKHNTGKEVMAQR
jgi:hypothetical protein